MPESAVDTHTRIERALASVLEGVSQEDCPAGLRAAVHYAVFPGGARIRPRLCLQVARACGDPEPQLSTAAAVAIELLHCASLVHDDLPCFDNASLRRGKASVHRAFGEPLAVLTGDALIVLAFEAVADAADVAPRRLKPLVQALSRATGMPGGIVAGQAWECEPQIDLSRYQRAKTGALFAAATAAGAAATGAEPAPWMALGNLLGEAFQVADDIRDVADTTAQTGKDSARDAALGRPNAALQLGLRGALGRLDDLISAAVEAIPPCTGGGELRQQILAESARLLPPTIARPMRGVA